MKHARPILLSMCLSFLLVACGGGDGGQGQSGSTRCTVGEKKACACTNGDTGFKLCNDDEHWDACSCSGTPDPDVVVGDDVTIGDDAHGGDDGANDDVTCHPACGGKECGPDGCGGTCGTCGAGETCDPSYTCQPGTCQPDCDGKECGPDGCNGTCGSCASGEICDVTAQCVPGGCQPDCDGRECGPDGCDGSCGTCGTGSQCDTELGTCHTVCQPSCTGKVCGDNGCGGSCGSCASGKQCSNGQCVSTTCTPQCSGKVCGPNGCGGTCGTCASGSACQSGQCVASAQIDCEQMYLDCFPQCAEGDQACMQACYDKLSPTGKAETDPLLTCLNDNCADATDISQCVGQNCWNEYVGCFHGDKTCQQVVSCIDGCGAANEACWADCLGQGTAQAQIDWNTQSQQCIIDLCCPTDTALCNEGTGATCVQNGWGVGGACDMPTISCP